MATDAITTDQAHREGYDAFRAGQSGSRKPYPSTTPQGRAWVDGWLAAQGERAEAERNGTWNTPASEASATAAGNPGSPTGVTSPDCPAGTPNPAGPFSQHKEAAMSDSAGITGERLRSYVDRIRRLNEEIADLNADKREVFAEAKADGFDKKAMQTLIKRLDADQQELFEHDQLVQTYENAYKNAGRAQAHARGSGANDDTRVSLQDGNGETIWEGTGDDLKQAADRAQAAE
jgi:uncharacterized protein (UPF0335 family)/ribosome modulation factor